MGNSNSVGDTIVVPRKGILDGKLGGGEAGRVYIDFALDVSRNADGNVHIHMVRYIRYILVDQKTFEFGSFTSSVIPGDLDLAVSAESGGHELEAVGVSFRTDRYWVTPANATIFRIMHNDSGPESAVGDITTAIGRATIRIEGIEIIAIIGGPGKIVSAECDEWKSGVVGCANGRLIKGTDFSEYSAFSRFLAIVTNNRVHDRVGIIVVAHATPNSQDLVIGCGKSNARYLVLIFG